MKAVPGSGDIEVAVPDAGLESVPFTARDYQDRPASKGLGVPDPDPATHMRDLDTAAVGGAAGTLAPASPGDIGRARAATLA